MNDIQAKALVERFAEKQDKGRFPCPRCGHMYMASDPSMNALSRRADVQVCYRCGMIEAMEDAMDSRTPLSEWAIAQNPKFWRMNNRYFYTFGSSPDFPYQEGWVEVRAISWDEAHAKFRARFPDQRKNTLHCSFFYGEERWIEMDPEHNWPGWRCFEVIE